MASVESESLPFLSAKELAAYRKPNKILPRREPKDTPISISSLPSIYLEQTALLKEQHVEKLGSLTRGEYDHATKLVEIGKHQGKFWHSMGYTDQGKKFLYPEEAIFLMETARLEVYQGKVPLSIQEAYAKLLSDSCPVDHYHVYAHLSRLGYVVIRHAHRFFTPYERRLGLHSHLYKNPKQTQADTASKSDEHEEVIVTNVTKPKPRAVITLSDSPDAKKSKTASGPDLIVLDDDDSDDGSREASRSSNQCQQSRTLKIPTVTFPNMAGKTVLKLEIPHPSLLPPNVQITSDMCTVDLQKLHLATKWRAKNRVPYKGPWWQRRHNQRGGFRYQRRKNQYNDRRHWSQNQDERNSNWCSDNSPYQGHHSFQQRSQDRFLDGDRDGNALYVGNQRTSIDYRSHSTDGILHNAPYTTGIRGNSLILDHTPALPQTFNSFNLSRNEQRLDGSPQTMCLPGFSANREPLWLGGRQTFYEGTSSQGSINDPFLYSYREQRSIGTPESSGFQYNVGNQRFDNVRVTNYFHGNNQNGHWWSNHTRQNNSLCNASYQGNSSSNQRWSFPHTTVNRTVPLWNVSGNDRRDEVWEGFPENNTSGPYRWNSSQNISQTDTSGSSTQRWDHSPHHKNFQVKDRRDLPTKESSSSQCSNSSNRQRWDNSRQDSKYQLKNRHKERERGKLPKPSEAKEVVTIDETNSPRREDSGSQKQKDDVATVNYSSWREYKKQLAADRDVESLKTGAAACLWNGPVTPLVEPKDAISSARVLEVLRTVKRLNLSKLPQSRFSKPNPTLKITYDVFLPNSGFTKSKPKFPNHRIIVTRAEDPFPNLADIGAPLAALDDGVPLHFAVVDNGSVSFYSFNDVTVPVQSVLG